ncbi:MAG: type II toxin-antitoxin system VapC family toxin [Thermoleophilia bacterium]|nr:type II toxin-antitoxin system VapC family toxin [Thermoleophilia bacterium]
MTPANGAVVCDASVFVAVAFAEPDSPRARALTRSRRLYAPPLLRSEVAHAAVKKCARRPKDAPLVKEFFLRSLLVPVRRLEPSWPAVLEIAREHNLSAYDASYLQVAQALGVPLATLDARLAEVARGLGVLACPTEA